MIIETDPSSVGEEAARVGVVLDLLSGPEAEGGVTCDRRKMMRLLARQLRQMKT